jgi:hypothetical protein
MMDNICPFCHGTVDPFGKCEYCGKIVNNPSNQKNKIGDDKLTFPAALEQLENNIRELKTYPTPSLIENIFHTLLNIITLGFYSIIRKRIIKSNSFISLEAKIVQIIRNMKAFYGGNSEADKLINELEQEFSMVKLKYEDRKKKTNIGCIIVAFAIVILLLIIARAASNSEETSISNESTSEIITKIQQDINSNNLEEAKILTSKLGMDDKKDFLRKIQFADIEFRISKIKNMSLNGNSGEAEEEYNHLSWDPIDNPKFNYKEIEATRKFIEMKESLRKYLDSKKSK